MKLKILSIVLTSMFLVSSTCSKGSAIPLEPIKTTAEPRQVSTLRQISDYPFYVYVYPGDYGFEEYLKMGVHTQIQPLLPVESDFACSVFSVFNGDSHAILGRNFDWYRHPILLLFTQPSTGYRSVSMVDISYLGYDEQLTPLDDPQALSNAPYLPFDGMNEAGLAVGMMSVPHAEGGNDPVKSTLDSLELIRLMLDYAGDVQEAVQLIQDYNVDFGSVPVHYLVADRGGHSAVIEYIDGELVVIRNEKDWQISTNFLLTEQPAPGSCWRYALLETALRDKQGDLTMEESMDLLRSVSQTGSAATRWSVVYNLVDRTLQVAVGADFDSVYEFLLDY